MNNYPRFQNNSNVNKPKMQVYPTQEIMDNELLQRALALVADYQLGDETNEGRWFLKENQINDTGSLKYPHNKVAVALSFEQGRPSPQFDNEINAKFPTIASFIDSIKQPPQNDPTYAQRVSDFTQYMHETRANRMGKVGGQYKKTDSNDSPFGQAYKEVNDARSLDVLLNYAKQVPEIANYMEQNEFKLAQNQNKSDSLRFITKNNESSVLFVNLNNKTVVHYDMNGNQQLSKFHVPTLYAAHKHGSKNYTATATNPQLDAQRVQQEKLLAEQAAERKQLAEKQERLISERAQESVKALFTEVDFRIRQLSGKDKPNYLSTNDDGTKKIVNYFDNKGITENLANLQEKFGVPYGPMVIPVSYDGQPSPFIYGDANLANLDEATLSKNPEMRQRLTNMNKVWDNIEITRHAVSASRYKFKPIPSDTPNLNRAKMKEGNIIIPAYNINGEVVGGQIIYHDGQKFVKNNIKNTSVNDNFFPMGLDRLKGDLSKKKIFFAEGFTTGFSLFENADDDTIVIVGFGGPNQSNLPRVFKERYPTLKIENLIIATDNDDNGRFTAKNSGFNFASQAHEKYGSSIFYPDFSSLRQRYATVIQSSESAQKIEQMFDKFEQKGDWEDYANLLRLIEPNDPDFVKREMSALMNDSAYIAQQTESVSVGMADFREQANYAARLKDALPLSAQKYEGMMAFDTRVNLIVKSYDYDPNTGNLYITGYDAKPVENADYSDNDTKFGRLIRFQYGLGSLANNTRETLEKKKQRINEVREMLERNVNGFETNDVVVAFDGVQYDVDSRTLYSATSSEFGQVRAIEATALNVHVRTEVNNIRQADSMIENRRAVEQKFGRFVFTPAKKSITGKARVSLNVAEVAKTTLASDITDIVRQVDAVSNNNTAFIELKLPGFIHDAYLLDNGDYSQQERAPSLLTIYQERQDKTYEKDGRVIQYREPIPGGMKETMRRFLTGQDYATRNFLDNYYNDPIEASNQIKAYYQGKSDVFGAFVRSQMTRIYLENTGVADEFLQSGDQIFDLAEHLPDFSTDANDELGMMARYFVNADEAMQDYFQSPRPIIGGYQQAILAYQQEPIVDTIERLIDNPNELNKNLAQQSYANVRTRVGEVIARELMSSGDLNTNAPEYRPIFVTKQSMLGDLSSSDSQVAVNVDWTAANIHQINKNAFSIDDRHDFPDFKAQTFSFLQGTPTTEYFANGKYMDQLTSAFNAEIPGSVTLPNFVPNPKQVANLNNHHLHQLTGMLLLENDIEPIEGDIENERLIVARQDAIEKAQSWFDPELLRNPEQNNPLNKVVTSAFMHKRLRDDYRPILTELARIESDYFAENKDKKTTHPVRTLLAQFDILDSLNMDGYVGSHTLDDRDANGVHLDHHDKSKVTAQLRRATNKVLFSSLSEEVFERAYRNADGSYKNVLVGQLDEIKKFVGTNKEFTSLTTILRNAADTVREDIANQINHNYAATMTATNPSGIQKVMIVTGGNSPQINRAFDSILNKKTDLVINQTPDMKTTDNTPVDITDVMYREINSLHQGGVLVGVIDTKREIDGNVSLPANTMIIPVDLEKATNKAKALDVITQGMLNHTKNRAMHYYAQELNKNAITSNDRVSDEMAKFETNVLNFGKDSNARLALLPNLDPKHFGPVFSTNEPKKIIEQIQTNDIALDLNKVGQSFVVALQDTEFRTIMTAVVDSGVLKNSNPKLHDNYADWLDRSQIPHAFNYFKSGHNQEVVDIAMSALAKTLTADECEEISKHLPSYNERNLAARLNGVKAQELRFGTALPNNDSWLKVLNGKTLRNATTNPELANKIDNLPYIDTLTSFMQGSRDPQLQEEIKDTLVNLYADFAYNKTTESNPRYDGGAALMGLKGVIKSLCDNDENDYQATISGLDAMAKDMFEKGEIKQMQPNDLALIDAIAHAHQLSSASAGIMPESYYENIANSRSSIYQDDKVVEIQRRILEAEKAKSVEILEAIKFIQDALDIDTPATHTDFLMDIMPTEVPLKQEIGLKELRSHILNDTPLENADEMIAQILMRSYRDDHENAGPILAISDAIANGLSEAGEPIDSDLVRAGFRSAAKKEPDANAPQFDIDLATRNAVLVALADKYHVDITNKNMRLGSLSLSEVVHLKDENAKLVDKVSVDVKKESLDSAVPKWMSAIVDQADSPKDLAHRVELQSSRLSSQKTSPTDLFNFTQTSPELVQEAIAERLFVYQQRVDLNKMAEHNVRVPMNVAVTIRDPNGGDGDSYAVADRVLVEKVLKESFGVQDTAKMFTTMQQADYIPEFGNNTSKRFYENNNPSADVQMVVTLAAMKMTADGRDAQKHLVEKIGLPSEMVKQGERMAHELTEKGVDVKQFVDGLADKMVSHYNKSAEKGYEINPNQNWNKDVNLMSMWLAGNDETAKGLKQIYRNNGLRDDKVVQPDPDVLTPLRPANAVAVSVPDEPVVADELIVQKPEIGDFEPVVEASVPPKPVEIDPLVVIAKDNPQFVSPSHFKNETTLNDFNKTQLQKLFKIKKDDKPNGVVDVNERAQLLTSALAVTMIEEQAKPIAQRTNGFENFARMMIVRTYGQHKNKDAEQVADNLINTTRNMVANLTDDAKKAMLNGKDSIVKLASTALITEYLGRPGNIQTLPPVVLQLASNLSNSIKLDEKLSSEQKTSVREFFTEGLNGYAEGVRSIPHNYLSATTEFSHKIVDKAQQQIDVKLKAMNVDVNNVTVDKTDTIVRDNSISGQLYDSKVLHLISTYNKLPSSGRDTLVNSDQWQDTMGYDAESSPDAVIGEIVAVALYDQDFREQFKAIVNNTPILKDNSKSNATGYLAHLLAETENMDNMDFSKNRPSDWDKVIDIARSATLQLAVSAHVEAIKNTKVAGTPAEIDTHVILNEVLSGVAGVKTRDSRVRDEMLSGWQKIAIVPEELSRTPNANPAWVEAAYDKVSDLTENYVMPVVKTSVLAKPLPATWVKTEAGIDKIMQDSPVSVADKNVQLQKQANLLLAAVLNTDDTRDTNVLQMQSDTRQLLLSALRFNGKPESLMLANMLQAFNKADDSSRQATEKHLGLGAVKNYDNKVNDVALSVIKGLVTGGKQGDEDVQLMNGKTIKADALISKLIDNASKTNPKLDKSNEMTRQLLDKFKTIEPYVPKDFDTAIVSVAGNVLLRTAQKDDIKLPSVEIDRSKLIGEYTVKNTNDDVIRATNKIKVGSVPDNTKLVQEAIVRVAAHDPEFKNLAVHVLAFDQRTSVSDLQKRVAEANPADNKAVSETDRELAFTALASNFIKDQPNRKEAIEVVSQLLSDKLLFDKVDSDVIPKFREKAYIVDSHAPYHAKRKDWLEDLPNDADDVSLADTNENDEVENEVEKSHRNTGPKM